MENKSLLIRAGHPVRLCGGCRDALETVCAGRYTLRLTGAHSRKALCALCGRTSYTLEYEVRKEETA